MNITDDFPERLRQYFKMDWLPIEGGYFTQTYRSPEAIPMDCLPESYKQERPFGTAILYLFTDDPNCFSALHRLPTDEVYHFYLGDPVEMLLLYPEGRNERVILGQDIFNGQRIQSVVPKGVWQGSHLLDGSRFALIGTTMAPGYVDADYMGGDREELMRLYPGEEQLIHRLTR